jgi:hypothetical protein
MKMTSPAKTQEAQGMSQHARLLVGFIVLGGAAVIGRVGLSVRAWPHLPFLAMLAVALPASRLKLKLPGLNGNMSMNLPFVLLAAVTLSAFEALVLATVSAAVQTLPQHGNRIRPVQMIFNVSTMALLSGWRARSCMGELICYRRRHPWQNCSCLQAPGCCWRRLFR